MIIAVDFDGTIVEHNYPKIGKEIPFAIATLKKLQAERHLLILWTVREGDLLQEAVDYCRRRGLEFYAVNANNPDEQPAALSTPCRKVCADMYIDDCNVGTLPDWAPSTRWCTTTGAMTSTDASSTNLATVRSTRPPFGND